jgi:hypothetical protein
MSFGFASIALFALLFLQYVVARDLVPVAPPSGGIAKRATAALDLQNFETFLWGNDGMCIGNTSPLREHV